ncbi:YpmS family protein [Streptococcus dentiloxodontae]
MTKLWKWLFLGLLALNLAFVGVVFYKITSPSVLANSSKTVNHANEVQIGSFTMTKSELNDALSAFAKDYSTDDMSFDVTVTSSNILFEGTYTLLGYDVPLYVYFTPVVLENGGIQLQVTDVSAGSLSLPVSDALKFLKSSVKNLPSYIDIDSEKEVINVNLQEINNKTGVIAKATSLDLVNDHIEFNIYKTKT